MRRCTKCNVEKAHSEFYKHAKGKDGLQANCKQCQSASAKARRINTDKEQLKSEALRTRLWTLYRLTVEQYERMTSNGCMACGSFEDLVVDHDHACCSGKRSCGKCVRGVLCGACNKAEGFLGSDPNRVLALAAYLIQTKEASYEATN